VWRLCFECCWPWSSEATNVVSVLLGTKEGNLRRLYYASSNSRNNELCTLRLYLRRGDRGDWEDTQNELTTSKTKTTQRTYKDFSG
ncbi:Os01g0876500, partial [Oryza sativa Japonica Group]